MKIRPQRDWLGNSKSTYVTLGASNHSENEREHRDYYATDPAAVKELLERETFASNILEPCCGEGHIAKALVSAGYTVQAQDLYEYGYAPSGKDFLACNPPDWDSFDIITNPPYSLANEFVLHALEILPHYHRVAMFLRLQFLEGVERYQRLYSLGALEKVYVAAKRAHCAMNGDFAKQKGTAICYAWFIWRKGWRGAPTLDWFNIPQEGIDRQQTLPLL